MRPEAQRIAIAETCGWKNIRYSDNLGQSILSGTHPLFEIQQAVPDYLNNLSAMHEAVMAQPPGTRLLFRKELQYMIAPRTRPGSVCGIVLMCGEDYDLWFHATAAQRAEAFLRTLDLWKDNE